jgi:hypothetical protein
MRKMTRHSSPARGPRNGNEQDSEGIVALSARLTGLADRICAANSGKSSNKSGNKRAGRLTPPEPGARPDDRIWPQLPPLPPIAEARLPPFPDEMASRNFNVDDLAVPLPQADELRRACDQIDHLITTINALRLEADRRDIDLATATQHQIEAENEISSLKAALGAERQKTAALSHRLIEIETAFNDRLVDFTIHRESAERLSSELVLARTEAPKALAAAEVRAHKLFAEQVARLSERHEQQADGLRTSFAAQFAQLTADHEKQVQELHSLIAGRDGDKRILEQTQVELALIFCAMSEKIAGLEADKEQAAEAIRAQAGQIEFLETSTVIERQNAEATIKELAAEFGREREQLLARENAAAEIRKNIVQLLPRLIARRSAAEPETAQVA